MLKRNSSTNGQYRSYSSSHQTREERRPGVVGTVNTIPTRQSQYNSKEEVNLTDSRAIQKLAGGTALVHLDLSRNSIKGESAFWAALKELQNLRTINLQSNLLVAVQLNYLPDQVTSIDLSHNSLQQLSLNRHHPALKTLLCHHNKLLKASFPTGNPSLETLDLSHNKISLLNTIQLTNLNLLDASNNQLVVINLNNSIKKIWLSDCSLKSIAFIAKLKNLEEIKLNGNHLTDIRMNGFIVKVGLARVELSGNRIRYVEGLQVACPNLKYLDISKNQIYSLKNLYTELRQLNQLEELDIVDNEFYRTEPKEHLQQIQVALSKQLTALRSFNGNPITVRKNNQSSRNSRSRPPLASVRVPEPSNLPTHKSIQLQGKPKSTYSSQVTPEKPAIQPAISQASYSNFKESPYRLCDDLLTSGRSYSLSGRGYSGLKEKSTQKPKQTIESLDNTINFTLGQKQSFSRASLEDRYDGQQNSKKLTDLQETVYGGVNQNVSFAAKKPAGKCFEHSLYKLNDFLDELVSMSIIPVRPILKTEKTKDICHRLQQGKQVQQLKSLFKLCNKRPDLVKKNTNLAKIQQIRSELKQRDKLCLGFLRIKNLDSKKFKLLAGGKISLLEILKDSSKAWVSVSPDKTIPYSIIILFKKRLTTNQLPTDDIPMEKIDKLTLMYLIQCNQIDPDF